MVPALTLAPPTASRPFSSAPAPQRTNSPAAPNETPCAPSCAGWQVAHVRTPLAASPRCAVRTDACSVLPWHDVHAPVAAKAPTGSAVTAAAAGVVAAGASWHVAHAIFAFAWGVASGRSLPDGVPAAPSATPAPMAAPSAPSAIARARVTSVVRVAR